MREFEILPDEAAIKKMAVEYNRIKERKELLKSADNCSIKQSASVEKNTHNIDRKPVFKLMPCVLNEEEKAAFKSAYCLAVDILKVLTYLKSRSQNRIAAQLSKVIADKNRNLEKMAIMYSNLCKAAIDYTSELKCNIDYQNAFNRLMYMQNDLILKESRLYAGSLKYKVALSTILFSELCLTQLLTYLKGVMRI